MEGLSNMTIAKFLIMYAERYAFSLARTTLILGGLYVVFWALKSEWKNKYRIPTIGNLKPKPLLEYYYTATTYFVYALFGVVVALSTKFGGPSGFYANVSDMGWAYTLLSVPLFIFVADTQFYWAHLVMHKSKLVYRWHKPHHQFINVTPFSAYAFHFGEAVINAGSFMLMLLFVPWHPIALLVFVLFSITYNGMIHSGYDLFPKAWATHPIMKWFNTPTHHTVHHQRSNCNYSFMLTFWDKLMGTEDLSLSKAGDKNTTVTKGPRQRPALVHGPEL